jgi:cobalamin biosynthesis Mg chelatase CobN
MTEPGYTILDASSENCNNSTWTDLLANCEDCANTFNILRYYGDQVEAAAEDCGLTATFSPSAGASSEAEASSTVSSTTYYSDTVTVATKTTSQVEASTPVAAAATSTGYTAVASGTGLPSPSLNGTSSATQSAAPTAQEEFAGAGVKLGSHIGATILAACAFLQCLLQ